MIPTNVYKRFSPGFSKQTSMLVRAGILFAFTTPALALDEGVVAKVNGELVHQSTVDAVALQLQGRQQAPDKSQIVNELINLNLLSQLAKKGGLHESDEIKSVLELQRLQVLANAYMGKLSEEIDLPDETLKAEYDKQVTGIEKPEYKASQILLGSEAEAIDVTAKLADGGSFVELAKELSTDPGGKNGGDLGWFQSGAMPPEITAALDTLQPGDVTAEPVKTDYGWHVLILNDKRGTPVPDFEAVKPQIRNAMVSRELQNMIIKLRETAEIELAQ